MPCKAQKKYAGQAHPSLGQGVTSPQEPLLSSSRKCVTSSRNRHFAEKNWKIGKFLSDAFWPCDPFSGAEKRVALVRVERRKFKSSRTDINLLCTNFHRRFRMWPQNWYFALRLTRERYFVQSSRKKPKFFASKVGQKRHLKSQK